MKKANIDFDSIGLSLNLPDYTDILFMKKVLPLSNPKQKIQKALTHPLDSLPLKEIVRKKLESNPKAQAVVVISDNTRPVPYSGESGILLPVIEHLNKAGLALNQILILIATGTHREMNKKELRKMLDPRIFSLGLQIISHDSRNKEDLTFVGRTDLGGNIFLNRYYVESDIKILTGLVESHFMAGVSGGRKSICPGLIAEDSIYVLHSGSVLASPKATNLILEGNPCHEEAIRVAQMAVCDMSVNVTLDSEFRLTGIFAGDMETSLKRAHEKVCSYAAILFQKEYDLVITHAGLVGVNHYQAAKAGVTAAPLIKDGGYCIIAARHTDPDPVGGENYKKMMQKLRKIGSEKFIKMILDPDWNFVPEQWEAQMWTRLFKIIPPKNLIYCTLEIPEEAFTWLPETDARTIAPGIKNLQELVQKSIDWTVKQLRLHLGREPRIAFLPDGPYGIPVRKYCHSRLR